MEAVLDALHSLGFDYKIALANLVNFLIIFYLLKRFFFGTLKDHLSKRRDTIEQGLIDARDAKARLTSAEEEKKAIVTSAHAEAAGIVEASKGRANEIAKSIEETAQEKAGVIIADANKKSASLIADGERELGSKARLTAISMVENILQTKMSPEENEKFIGSILSSK